MWGHNRPASEEPAESSNLWLQVLCSDLQNAAVRPLGSARGGQMRLGLPGEKARKKQGAMNYLKHANRYGRLQLL